MSKMTTEIGQYQQCTYSPMINYHADHINDVIITTEDTFSR